MSNTHLNPQPDLLGHGEAPTLPIILSSQHASEVKLNKNEDQPPNYENLLIASNPVELNEISYDDTELIETEEYYSPEGLAGWIIVFAAFCTNFVVDGISLSYGVMTDDITAKMKAGNFSSSGQPAMSIAEFNTVACVLIAITLMMGPAASVIADKCGFRKSAMAGSIIATVGIFLPYAISPKDPSFWPFLIGFGVLTGVGFGIMFTASIVIVGLYFKKNRPLATGITVAGTGVGTLTLAPIMHVVLKAGGWQYAIFFQTALCAFSTLFGLAYRPIPKRVVKVRRVDVKREDIPLQQQLKELLTSPSYLIIAFSGSLIMMGYFAPFGYVVDSATLIIGKDQAVFLLTILGVVNAVGRVLFGLLANKIGHALLISNISLTVGGLVTLCYPFASSHELLILCAITFGVYAAVLASMRSIVIIEIIQEDKFNVGFGLSLIFMGFATLFSNSLGGLLKQATGTYDMAFFVAGIFLMAAAIICYPLSCIIQCEKGIPEQDSCPSSNHRLSRQRRTLVAIKLNT